MRKLTLMVFVALISLAACKKTGCTATEKDATILWLGPVPADGCDWAVKMNSGEQYHPVVLNNAFKQDSLKVKVCYTVTGDTFVCGWGNKIPNISVSAIEAQ